MEKKLFSVIVLCYRHFDYLYSAIDSVLAQDYPEVELIISDDCSENFPHEEICRYIAEKKGNNIKSVIVRQQERNGGTVKHLNGAIASANGYYIVALAGDDNLYDEHVLTSYVDGFFNCPDNCFIEMAQTAMYDEDLIVFQDYYLKNDVRAAIEASKDPKRSDLLYVLIEKGACLPSTSTCFTRAFFDRFGGFDENYTLVEDYPMHIRLAEEHWVVNYVDFVAIKHRHGGISHGQKGALSRSQMLYLEDSEKMLTDLLFPRLGILEKQKRIEVLVSRAIELKGIRRKLLKNKHDFWGLVKLLFTDVTKDYPLIWTDDSMKTASPEMNDVLQVQMENERKYENEQREKQKILNREKRNAIRSDRRFWRKARISKETLI